MKHCILPTPGLLPLEQRTSHSLPNCFVIDVQRCLGDAGSPAFLPGPSALSGAMFPTEFLHTQGFNCSLHSSRAGMKEV